MKLQMERMEEQKLPGFKGGKRNFISGPLATAAIKS